jgi:hypothetical protein
MAVETPEIWTPPAPRARSWRPRWAPGLATVAAWGAGAVLVLLAAHLRLRALDARFWIDEGISVGIARHHLGDIPSVLRLDGSPPLYYLLLGVWIRAFGASETAVHALSALFAIAAVPAAWWALHRTDRRAAWIASALVALLPLLNQYADEARMYSLVFLEALLASGAFLRAYVEGRDRWAPAFGVALAALVYTHGWGVFFGVAAFAGALALDRGAVRRIAIGFGLAALLFVPWVPTQLFQLAHTGAPWSHRPSTAALGGALDKALGGAVATVALLVVAAGALWTRLPAGRGGRVLAGVAAGTILLAWGFSHFGSPAWADRYFVTFTAPLVLAAAVGLAAAGPAGVIAIALAAVTWYGHPSMHTLRNKSDAHALIERLAPQLRPGATIFVAQPEVVPVLHYYLPRADVHWVTPLGPSADPGVTDWRDAMAHLRAATYARVLAPRVRALAPGAQLLAIDPRFASPSAPWTRRVRTIARRWMPRLRHDPHLRTVLHISPRQSNNRSTLTARLFVAR